MIPSQDINSVLPYLKATPDCKEECAVWPMAEDTPAEAGLKQMVAREAVSEPVVAAFQKLVHGYAAEHRRELPWRQGFDPYRVLVSEVMLQQTQVERVISKFLAFVDHFPDLHTLAKAPLPELLAFWQGLGYNRRALNLQRAAKMIVEQWDGSVPNDPLLLRQLPGIGPYTAGAICSFAFNQPQIFLETNIRAVLLHFFYAGQQGITDKQLLPVVEAVLDYASPRDWYNGLMDYGSDLKRRFPNPARRSRHHAVQGRFEGSDRQIRGAILRLLLQDGRLSLAALKEHLKTDEKRLQQILEGLLRDGLLQRRKNCYSVAQAPDF